MKKKNFLIATIVLLTIAMVVYALPALNPPPVNQQLAVYDTSTNNFNESLCRNCHNTTFQNGVPTRHHELIYPDNKINPVTGIVYDCLDCHPATSSPDGYGILIDRNCIACHNGTAFYGIGSKVNITRPHHNTTLAQSRSCGNTTGCHGSVIDNYNDNHYVPGYNISIVTPDTSYKVYNSTSGRYWGGCEACHRGDITATPKINNNNDTHHNALVGVTLGLPSMSPTTGCTWCHISSSGDLSIRDCEDCHSVKTIHNIQYNYTATNGTKGYGHIGTNWDCKGCHAWYDAGAAPFQGVIIPSVSGVSPSVLLANGQSTVVTIAGTNLLQDPYPTTVTVDSNTITTTSITNSEIVATVPALSVGDHAIQVAKGDVVSGFSALTVAKQVTISSAKLTTDGVKTLTITGTGFGPQPANAQQYVTFVHAGKAYHSDSATSWTDTEIVVNPGPSAAVSDIVTVTIPTGSATAAITAGTVVSSITVTSPNGGENWKRGTTYPITWTSAGNPGDYVKIELLKGTSVSTIKSNVSNTGTHNWKISQSTGTNYKIRVTSKSNSLYTDTSDNNFQISR